MDKELEDIRQIKHMLENIDDGLEFEDDIEIRELYLKQKHALETALNYIENSIPKSVVEEKIEYLKHKDFIKLQVCYQHDNGALKQLEVLQELLQEKGEKQC